MKNDGITLPVLAGNDVIYIRIPKMSEFGFAFLKEQLDRFESAIVKRDVSDGHGNTWGPCSCCGHRMTVVRPGKVQCDNPECN